MTILFLDFDGTIVTDFQVRQNKHAAANPACVCALNRITDATGAGIVVTSSWRIGQTMVDLKSILNDFGVRGRLVGKTPAIHSKRLYEGQPGQVTVSAGRGDEINYWLRSSDVPVESFVILDDEQDMRPHTSRLVKTEWSIGLTEELADRAIEMLTRTQILK